MSTPRELDAYYNERMGPDYVSWGRSTEDSRIKPVVIREWKAESNRFNIHLYATYGMSLKALRGTATHGVEIYSGVSLGSPEYRDALAALASDARDGGVVFQDCQIANVGSPISPKHPFTGWIFFDRSADLLPQLDLSNKAHIVFLECAPLFTAEVVHAQRNGVDALLDIWNDEETGVWDLSRSLSRQLQG